MENLMLTLDLPRGVCVEIHPITTAVRAVQLVGLGAGLRHALT